MVFNRTLMDILVDAGEAYCSMNGSKYFNYPYDFDKHKNEYKDDTPSESNKSASWKSNIW